MHAIEVAETGGPEVLTYIEKPQASPGPGEVLIKADAIGVNFLDTYFRSGQYPRDVPFIIGNEVCGTVEAVGDDVLLDVQGAQKAGLRAVWLNRSGSAAHLEHDVVPDAICCSFDELLDWLKREHGEA